MCRRVAAMSMRRLKSSLVRRNPNPTRGISIHAVDDDRATKAETKDKESSKTTT